MAFVRQIQEFWKGKEARISFALGVSLFLCICHYQATPFQYVPLFQLGVFGVIFITGYVIFGNWKQTQTVGLGPRYLWIPLAIIAGSAVARLFIQHDSRTLAGALFMVGMFGLYIASRRYGVKALGVFMPIVVIGALSVIVQGMVWPSYAGNAGLFNNYAIAAEFLVFGWAVSSPKHQWWLAALVIVALFFSAAPEAIFYVAIMGLVVLLRKDLGKKIALPLGALGLCLVIATPLGFTQQLWARSFSMLGMTYKAVSDSTLTSSEQSLLLNRATDDRWLGTWQLSRSVSPLGHGLDVTNAIVISDPSFKVPHFIMLLITDQLGPIAAGAWLFAIIVGFVKTKWKYACLALGIFGVFQPFVWTQLAPYMWVTIGVASSSERGAYVFKDYRVGELDAVAAI